MAVKMGINGNGLKCPLQMQQRVVNLQANEELKLPQLVIMMHKNIYQRTTLIVLFIIERTWHHSALCRQI
jgi:hypothetical protein